MPTVTITDRAEAARTLLAATEAATGKTPDVYSYDERLLHLAGDLAKNGWFTHEQTAFRDTLIEALALSATVRRVRYLLNVWDAYTAWDKAAD